MSQPSSTRIRMLVLLDSSAVYFSIRKGRTSARSLRGLHRTLAAMSLASGVGLVCGWVPSAWNPADAPSRAFAPLRLRSSPPASESSLFVVPESDSDSVPVVVGVRN